MRRKTNRTTRAKRRRYNRTRRAMTQSQWSLVKLQARLRREAEQAEVARKKRETATPTDVRRAEWEAQQRTQHEEMLALIARVKARAERLAQRDHEVSIRDADLPILSVQWSPSSGRQ